MLVTVCFGRDIPLAQYTLNTGNATLEIYETVVYHEKLVLPCFVCAVLFRLVVGLH